MPDTLEGDPEFTLGGGALKRFVLSLGGGGGGKADDMDGDAELLLAIGLLGGGGGYGFTLGGGGTIIWPIPLDGIDDVVSLSAP